jgi:hypothetical protein
MTTTDFLSATKAQRHEVSQVLGKNENPAQARFWIFDCGFRI